MELPKTKDWRRLVKAIQNRQCILILGPGAAVDPDNPDAPPLSRQFARFLSKKIGTAADDSKPANLFYVAQRYCNLTNHERWDLEDEVKDFYSPFESRTTELHRCLAQLPFRLCITTTPDSFLLNAIDNINEKNPQSEFYRFRGAQSETQIFTPDETHPIVYELYGSLRDPGSLVLTENDLLDFLVRVVSSTPPLPPLITDELAKKENAFLFIGFGFQQWHVRILLHALGTHSHRNPSLVLESEDFFKHSDQALTTAFFEQSHKFSFRKLSVATFVGKLQGSFIKAYETPESSPLKPMPEDAPIVFLCYKHTNLDKVELIERFLHEAGIDTWRDEQNLRGGDRWDSVIRDVLGKQVDYVVVLQSQAMVGEVRGYCKREIAIALDTQPEFFSFSFLFPTRLESCNVLDPLRPFHVRDLYNEAVKDQPIDEGRINLLIEDIEADWRKRKRLEREQDGQQQAVSAG